MNNSAERPNVDMEFGQGTDPSARDNRSATPRVRAWRRFKSNRLAVWSSVYLVVLTLIVAAWPIALNLAAGSAFAHTHNPNQLSDLQFAAPGGAHWFGTDVHGRDLFSRILFGARISLLVGIVGAAVSLVIGVLWGALSGYIGGRIDSIMMRVVDILYSLPTIVFVIVLITTLGAAIK